MEITIDTIKEDFAKCEDWFDRYEKLISLGKNSSYIGPLAHNGDLVSGCESEVYVIVKQKRNTLRFVVVAYSDSALINGLLAIMLCAINGSGALSNSQKLSEVAGLPLLTELRILDSLGSKRSLGIKSILKTIETSHRRQLRL